MTTVKKTKQRKNKRELHQKEADAKYSSLLVQSKKSIRKELKVVKSFECQKIIRKIKSVKEELEQQYEQEQEQEQQQQEQEEANGKVKVSDGQHGKDNVNHVHGDEEGIEVKEEVKEDKGHSSSQTKLTAQQQQQQQLEKLDAKLKLIKNFDIDCALTVALQRVGLNLDVMETEDDKRDKNSNDNDRQDDDDDKHDDDDHSGDKQVDNPTNTNNTNNTNNNIIETLLKHKRVSSAMQSINEKVADYNLWLSRREEWLTNGCKGPVGRIERNTTADGMHTMRKKRSRNDDTILDMAGHDGASGLFIESLAGNSMTDPPPVNGNTSHGITEGYEDGYEEGDSSYFVDPYPPPLKKNRPGQRARKAKAMAIEAKMAGRVWDSSVNWREKKKQKQKKSNEKGDKETDVVNNKQEMMISASGLDKSKDIKVSEVVNMGKDWKEQGKAHPSWAAREAQKAKSGLGMVAFAGKKITFDD